MARSGWSTSNYLSVGVSPIAAVPCTISAWAFYTQTGVGQHYAGVTKSSGAAFRIGTNATDFPIATENDDTATAFQAASGSKPANNSWVNFVGVFASASSRTIYWNGGNSATNSGSAGATTLDTACIGLNLRPATPANAASGSIGEVAIWNVALNAQEAAALASGVPPWMIRPANLLGGNGAYWPCYGLASPEPDLSGGVHNMSITGSLSLANGPPVTLFTPKWATPPDIASAVAASTPWGWEQQGALMIPRAAIDVRAY